MSDFTISFDTKRMPSPPTQAQIDWLADIIRQCRTPQDIAHDNAAAQADHEREQHEGWSVR